VAEKTLNLDGRYTLFTGVGGIGTGMFFALEGNATLGRNESRLGRLLDVRDYCKLHIIAHYVAVLTGAAPSGSPVRVAPIGKVGRDPQGERLVAEMKAAGMDLRFVEAVSDRPTLLSVCFQYPDGSGGNITTSDAAAAALSVADVASAEPLLAEAGGKGIVLAAPEVPLEVRGRMLALGTKHGALRAASFASGEMAEAAQRGMFSRMDILAINEDEAAAMAGVAYDAADVSAFLGKVSAALGRFNPLMRIILSAGAAGAYGFDDGMWVHTPAAKVKVASTAGAGDALFGGTLAAFAAGVPFVVEGPERKALSDAPLRSAVDFGTLLAAYSVTSPHTIAPDASVDALLAFAKRLGLTLGEEVTRVL
jgi:sugar/nucleoside kinase (ribokinase family)